MARSLARSFIQSLELAEDPEDVPVVAMTGVDTELEVFLHGQPAERAAVLRDELDPALGDVRNRVAGDVLAEFLDLLDGLDFGVMVVYLDRGFYNSTCLELPNAHNYVYVMPIVKWGEAIHDELSSGCSREIEHDLAGEVTFPVFID